MRTAFTLLALCVVVAPAPAAGEIHKHTGSPHALPHDKFVRVIDEADSPVQQTYIKSKDGAYVAAAIRKPRGEGPFPSIVTRYSRRGVLLQGTLDALELSVSFVKSPATR